MKIIDNIINFINAFKAYIHDWRLEEDYEVHGERED